MTRRTEWWRGNPAAFQVHVACSSKRACAVDLVGQGAATRWRPARAVLICLVAVSRGAHICLEQPGTSLLSRHPRWELLAGSLFKVWKVRFPMGQYGSGSSKPTLLYSTCKALVEKLATPPKLSVKPAAKRIAAAKRYVDKKGQRRCVGLPALKGTQPRAQPDLS